MDIYLSSLFILLVLTHFFINRMVSVEYRRYVSALCHIASSIFCSYLQLTFSMENYIDGFEQYPKMKIFFQYYSMVLVTCVGLYVINSIPYLTLRPSFTYVLYSFLMWIVALITNFTMFLLLFAVNEVDEKFYLVSWTNLFSCITIVQVTLNNIAQIWSGILAQMFFNAPQISFRGSFVMTIRNTDLVVVCVPQLYVAAITTQETVGALFNHPPPIPGLFVLTIDKINDAPKWVLTAISKACAAPG